MKTIAIVQARMSSSRLPGKVLLPLGKGVVVDRVFRQLSFARTLDEVMLATSTDASDDCLAQWAERTSIPCFRGSLDDVLARYYHAATTQKADIIVRVTADCPLIDPEVVDRVVNEFLSGSYDYVSNVLPPTFPDGEDTEAISFSALKRAMEEAHLFSEREHVTPYIRNHPELFRIGNVASPEDLAHHRWTLDNREDYEFLTRVFDQLDAGDAYIRMNEVLRLLKSKEEITEINSHIARDEGYRESLLKDKKDA
jgi:spore coat polysaccharide biosynthesis protein SpsF (cytidylyltransferase family)